MQEDTYRSAKTIHSKWTRHQAFESEIESNKERLERVKESGEELLRDKPEMSDLIRPKIYELETGFDELQRSAKEKGERIFDAKRADLYEQSCDDIDSFVMDLERQIETEPVGNDLTSVNILMQKQQMIETQMQVKSQQVSELDDQAEKLVKMEPAKKEEIESKKLEVARKFERVMAPLEARKRELAMKKEIFQFLRDVEDENIWIEEKMNLVTSEDYGDSLQAVNMLIKKNKTLKGEIDNHEPIIHRVCDDGRRLIDSGHPDSDQFRRDLDDLVDKLQHLKEMLEVRRQKLLVSEKAQQFFFDANEAEAWMSEQELYMMVEDRGKDEFSAQNLMKKHEALETAVEDFSGSVRALGESARGLIADGHPDSEQIGVRLAQVEKLYAGLRDLAAERRAKLDDALKLFMLNREVDDLEQWIAEREVVAGSHELGQDYEHVTLLWERFREFARDTDSIGRERVAAANETADALISSGHTDAATIAQWKDALNDAWADLGELIDTRTQMLEASRELHKYFHDCKDVLGRILEKQHSMSDELGRDAGAVSGLLRKHQNFVQDVQGLEGQVYNAVNLKVQHF